VSIDSVLDFNLCSKTSDTEINYIAVVILIVSQIFFSMASVSFISHGITYLDDNTSHGTSPGYIGIVLHLPYNNLLME
jgi:hypothetical protein